MQLADFQYQLPEELIATHPAARRDDSRLLVLARRTGAISHHRFRDLPALLRPGDCLVLNDSRVIPARLRARRAGGGAAELLLLRSLGDGTWEALARPARKLKPGARLDLPGGGEARVLRDGPDGTRVVALHVEGDVEDYLERAGEAPLPPYIVQQRKARGEAPAAGEDTERYQTVYARAQGSVAAPTAGLHFTEELLAELGAKGVEIQRVTLHVGLGTFEPVREERIDRHVMHREEYAIGAEAAAAISAARTDPGRRVVAVGTTTVRTLESCWREHGAIVAGRGETGIFLKPGDEFGVVDALVTNFHLPGSTLLMLVAAFAGREQVLAAYGEAIRERYRFYSYGDAMLIE